MGYFDLNKRLVELSELQDKGIQSRLSFYQGLILVITSLIAILISFYSNETKPLLAKIIFFSSITLFTCCILILIKLIHFYANIATKVAKLYGKKIAKALMSGSDDLGITSIPNNRIISSLEVLLFILLPIGLIALLAYAFIMVFEPKFVEKIGVHLSLLL